MQEIKDLAETGSSRSSIQKVELDEDLHRRNMMDAMVSIVQGTEKIHRGHQEGGPIDGKRDEIKSSKGQNEKSKY